MYLWFKHPLVLQNYLTSFVFMNMGGKIFLWKFTLPWVVSKLRYFLDLFNVFLNTSKKSRKCRKSLENVEKFSTNLGKVNFHLKNLVFNIYCCTAQRVLIRTYSFQPILGTITFVLWEKFPRKYTTGFIGPDGCQAVREIYYIYYYLK